MIKHFKYTDKIMLNYTGVFVSKITILELKMNKIQFADCV